MIKLSPHSLYSLLYQDGTEVRFETMSEVPEAKHLIQVKLQTGEVTDLVKLLLRPWIDIIADGSAM